MPTAMCGGWVTAWSIDRALAQERESGHPTFAVGRLLLADVRLRTSKTDQTHDDHPSRFPVIGKES